MLNEAYQRVAKTIINILLYGSRYRCAIYDKYYLNMSVTLHY